MAKWTLFLACLAATICAYMGPKRAPSRPNILFIFTDDQDVHMDSLSYMPLLKKYITDEGTLFSHHYCTVSLCCPSRANLWSGKAAHNTNVTDLSPPYGGYPKFVAQGFNTNYLPVWMQAAGWNTYYVGKLFNAHSVDNYNDPFPGGFTASDFLLDPYTYEYWNATMQRNREPPVSYEGQYSTDVVAAKAAGFLGDGIAAFQGSGTPFFLTVAPTAPHSNVHNGTQAPPRPATRHRGLFNESVVVPRGASFNPETASGVSWVAALPRQNRTNVAWNDAWYRDRLRTLQAVDEMVEALVTQLDDAGVLDDTYVFFSTDNGYSIGQHRRQPGKQCAFEEDINVPMIVRGPGVARGVVSESVTSHTDVAPTFLQIAGVEEAVMEGYELDGGAMPLPSSSGNGSGIGTGAAGTSDAGSREHVNAEMWGIILSEGIYGYVLYNNHTYKAIRVIGDGYSVLYTVWCTGQHELYDMLEDPWQMNNLVGNDSDPNAMFHIWQTGPGEQGQISTTVADLVDRLDALALVLKTCKTDACRRPWASIHPDGGVQNLAQALDSQFDEYYRGMPKVKWDKCWNGYIKEAEAPYWDDDLAFRDP
ncbi:Arylsulphatase [Xylariaceae sp. FL0016]|nr:Arylsulphatase [Xylariaceae sp. FL0016]